MLILVYVILSTVINIDHILLPLICTTRFLKYFNTCYKKDLLNLQETTNLTSCSRGTSMQSRSALHFKLCLLSFAVSINVTVKIFEAFELRSWSFFIHEMFFAPGILFFIEHVTVSVLPLVPTSIVSWGRICSSTKLMQTKEDRVYNAFTMLTHIHVHKDKI